LSHPVTSVPGRSIFVLDRYSVDNNHTQIYTGGKTRTLNISSYNYLGFAQARGGCADAVEQCIRRYNGTLVDLPRIVELENEYKVHTAVSVSLHDIDFFFQFYLYVDEARPALSVRSALMGVVSRTTSILILALLIF
jgi:hypothetical protein